MVKKQFVCALGAAVILGVCSTASAGGVVRINEGDSPDLALTTVGTAVSYAYVNDSYVADVTLQGFLFCNHNDTPATSPINLVARHGAWAFGSNAAGVVVPVPGINSVAYDGQALNLSADANTQCFEADAHGQGVTDLHHLFASGFDFGAVAANSPNTSAVTIAVDHMPVDGDDTFRYTITVQVADQGSQQTLGQKATHSLSTSDYYLNEGYDTSVFSNCNIVPGQSVTGNMTFTRACNVQSGVNLLQLDGAVPVVAAALFTGPNAGEKDFGDNLAFGYPAATPLQ